MMRGERSHLCGRTLELQQHHGAGTLHDVEVEQQPLLPVKTYIQNGQRKKTLVLKLYACISMTNTLKSSAPCFICVFGFLAFMCL